MGTSSFYELQAKMFQALGHPIRLELVHLLREGPTRVNDLVEASGLSQYTVSRHLAVLRNDGILNAQRRGQDILYSIADRRVLEACELIRQVLLGRIKRNTELLDALNKPDETT